MPHSSDENTALVDRAVHDSAVALRTVLESMERLDADALRAPSALPGWSRGHVLAHIDGAGNAAARQAEAVARGERVEFYDGGRQGRDTAIEAQAGRTLEEHAEALTRLAARLDAAWPERGSELWDQPTSYRDKPLSGVALMWWREVRIHLVDLQVSVSPGSWDDDLCRHLLDFLSPRLSGAGRTDLVADGTERPWPVNDDARAAGSDGVLTVRGELRDIAAWLAGREPETLPAAARAGQPQPLPELGPWPTVSERPRPRGD